jgi:tetratricopeptide (TPR) repeat protein
MASARKCAVGLLFVFGLCPRDVAGQSKTLLQALDLESAGKCAEALPLFRQSLGDGDVAGPLLGFERCAAYLGRQDTVLVVVDSILLRRPKDPTVRLVQLRTLTTTQRFDEARQAFAQWLAAVPHDPEPFRQYARQLLDEGRTRAADTVLQLAVKTLGNARELSAEMAELRASLGMWDASVRAWRDAMSLSPYLEQSAIFVLLQAPAAARDSVRTALAADPPELHARRILAGLELRWRSARDAWQALSTLPPNDSTVQAWIEFAADAEQQDAWRAASDAYTAALAHGADRSLSLKAATAALQGGEPDLALRLLGNLAAAGDSSLTTSVLLLQVRALSQLGRPQEADSVLAATPLRADTSARGEALRAIAWGWVRVGDLTKARTALARSGSDADAHATAWIALYEGDLKTARTGLRRIEETSREAVVAMSLLARTKADSSRKAGEAFLVLARSDTARAAELFEAAAGELPDGAPILLGIAARLYTVTPDSSRSLTIWQGIVDKYPDAPEAAEAELEWARTLRRHGDGAAAIARLEHLILTYPQSALVPQARRELEIAKGASPPVL